MQYYRYVDRQEEASIRSSNTIRSISGITYFAVDPPSAYSTRSDVSQFLAVPPQKDLRVGPVFDDHIPGGVWFIPPRSVAPQQLPDGTWSSGGGTEAATQGTVNLVEYTQLS